MGKKKNRNLIYAIPIAEVDEEWMKQRVSMVIGRDIDRIDLAAAAEYKGCLNAAWELRNISPFMVNGEELSSGALLAYSTQIPEPLSFAFRHAHGIQRFNIIEAGKRNKPNTEYLFSVTDVEFEEEYAVLFGLAKDKNTGKEKEYLVYYFWDQLEFFQSGIQFRELRHQVYIEGTEMEWKRLGTISMYAYKYLKKADEVRLSKLTEALTGLRIAKPGKQMFVALNKELQKEDNDPERQEVIVETLETAFHRYVQSFKEKALKLKELYVQDGKEMFLLASMENIRPCRDKKGFRFSGLRMYDNAPWNNYRINVEYDYKKNSFTKYDKDWEKVVGTLAWNDTAENIAFVKICRRWVNSFYNAKKAK